MLGGFVDSLYADGGIPAIVAGILAMALGLLESFLGYRIFKVQVAIIAFLAGLTIGMNAFDAAFGIFWLSIVLGVVLGVLLAWLSVKIYKVGVFLLVGAFAYLVAIAFVQNFWFGLIAGIVVGLLGVFLTKPVIILSTAFGGASMAGGGLAMLIWGSAQGGPGWLQWVIVAVLGVLGAVVQFRTTREIK
ncbi:MAG: hypothetical protein GXY32_00490 [Ruminococcaceae bacterium]|nr:hypothetical protein [Oscillospiraceae bacterium]